VSLPLWRKAHSFFFRYSDGRKTSLSIGKFLGEIGDEMEHKIRHGGGPLLFLFAGHDTTLMPLLCGLQVRFVILFIL
jgi:hypothetical protein